MRFRKLRIAWSVFWGVACVLLVVLWVRSYWWIDIVEVLRTKSSVWLISSDGGSVSVFSDDTSRLASPRLSHYSRQKLLEAARALGDQLQRNSFAFSADRVSVAHWFPIIPFAAIASLPWMGWPRWRFTIRTLLIATTLVAVVLGLIVWASAH